ncbi:MAG: hypothetical protein HY447_03940 [Candidatus Omnitrophica bacterium]|nr:hypothetical protein [Candidatus Omnitrophota bacterium]
MLRKHRNLRSLEGEFLRFYSAWQETHRMEFADRWMRLLGELLRLNPSYSVRHPFDRAF